MGTSTQPYSPAVAEKLGATCEKLRLVYWLYNNDDNGCGPVQGLPITFFGSWTMDEFYCDGVNILQAPVPISYNNWNDNFNQWTSVLNPLSPNHWDWINAGRPCFRVMSTITCDDTVYGDFKVTAVDVIRESANGVQYLIQPQPISGPEVELLTCITKDKNGETTKTFYDKSGDPILSLTDYYAQEAGHIIVSDTGAVPFTAANIGKFYTEEELCDCLKDCAHQYAHIDDSPPCEVKFFEGGCIYATDEDGNFITQDGTSETPTAFLENISQTLLFGDDGTLKSRTLVNGQFQENASDNDYIDEADLPDGWFYDATCTGTEPAPAEPPECPEGTDLQLGCIQEFGAFADNSRWINAPAVNMTGTWTNKATCEDGTEILVTGASWWPIRDALNEAGYTTNVACANWANCTPSGWPAWMPDPDIDTMFARGWFGVGCRKKIVRMEVVEHPDPAWIGAYKEIINVNAPVKQIWYANICGVLYAQDCDGNAIFVDKCCIKAPASGGSLGGVTTHCVVTTSTVDVSYQISDFDEGDLEQGDIASCSVQIFVPDGYTASIDPLPGYTMSGTAPNFTVSWVYQAGTSNPQQPLSATITAPDGSEGKLSGGDLFLCSGGGEDPTVELFGEGTACEYKVQGETSVWEDSDGNPVNPDDLEFCKDPTIRCLEDIKCLLKCAPKLDVGDPTYTVGAGNGSHASGGLVQFPAQAGQVSGPNTSGYTDDFMIPLSLPVDECLDDPNQIVVVRYCFDHEVTPSTTHIGFNVSPVNGIGTIIETGNGNGGISTPHVGPPVPRTQTIRTKQWVDVQYTVGQLQAGQALQTSAFGTTNAGIETLYSVDAQLMTDLECC